MKCPLDCEHKEKISNLEELRLHLFHNCKNAQVMCGICKTTVKRGESSTHNCTSVLLDKVKLMEKALTDKDSIIESLKKAIE